MSDERFSKLALSIWRGDLIPKPTEDQDGGVTWALRRDTRGGMFTVANDGTFSREAVLAQEGAGNSFTSSPNTKRKSPRAPPIQGAPSDEGPRKRRRTGREAQGRPTKRQQAKANRQACMVSGKALEEWRKDRTLWPFPRWRL
jgi:hypothetical protein